MVKMPGRLAPVAGAFACLFLAGHALAADKVVVAHGSGQVELTHPGLYLGKVQGFEGEEGIEIEVQLTQGSQQAMQLLAAGQVDVVSINSNTVFDGREQGVEARIVYSSVSHNNNYVGVLADGKYKSVADLAGTDVGVFSMTSGGVPFLKAVLAEAKIDPDKVNMVPIGAGPAAIEGLKNGTVSALSLWAGAFAAFENLGVKLTLLGSERLDAAPGYVLATTDKFIEEHPELIEKVGRVYAKSQLFAETSPEATVKAYWQVYPENRPTENAEKALAEQVHVLKVGLRDMRTSDRPDSRFGWNDPDGIEVFQEYLIENGARTVRIPIEDTYTNDFVDAFNAFDPEAVKAKAEAAGR
jgi:NitT/TauT family transport system substrate-binding protein